MCAESSYVLWREGTQVDGARVVQDACHHFVSQGERATTGGAVDDRRCASANRSQKRAEFRVQGFFKHSFQFLESDSRLRAAGLDANAQRVLAHEIKRDVFVFLEEAHLADALRRYPAGRHIGDGAGCELDPWV